MSNRTSIYKFLYSQFGDIWYPGYDYENMVSVERQLSGVNSIVGPGVINGWTIEKLSDSRANQLLLINGYSSSSTSEYGLKLSALNLDFTVVVTAATTSNITLSGTQLIDNVPVAVGDLVLVKNQSTSANNGIYTVASSGWTRHSSLDNSSDYNDNFVVHVEEGYVNGNTLWIGVTSSSSFSLGSTNLNFDDPFKQCVVVNFGNGIVSKYRAKTEKSFFFRYTAENTYYVWAEPGLSTLTSGFCNITSPSNPDKNYNAYSNAVYLGTVKVAADTTYTNIQVVNSIVLEERRNQINETTGEFQRQLQLSYLKHKHLGDKNPSQINLQNDVYLLAQSSDNFGSYNNSSIFLLKNQDGTSFTETLSNYGDPIVKVDGNTLDVTEYSITSVSPYTLYLKNTIKSTSKLDVILPIADRKNLIGIDSSYQKLTSTLSLETYYTLSDGTIAQKTNPDGSIYDYYVPFSWGAYEYTVNGVYINDELIDSVHYSLSNTSGTIYLNKSFPNYSNFTFEDLVVKIDRNQAEITGNLKNTNIGSVSASRVKSGKVSSNILDITHSNSYRFKEPCSFVPTKNLVAGIGRTILYPYNTSSTIQYNDSITSFYKSKNIDAELIYVGSKRGISLLNLNSNLSTKEYVDFADYGTISNIQDNILTAEDENYFRETYITNSFGKVNIFKDEVISELKSPKNSSYQNISVNKFFVSSNKIQSGSGNTITFAWQKDYYAATDDGVYFSQVLENTAVQDWDWRKLNNIFTTSGTAATYFDNVKSIQEVTTKTINVISSDYNEIVYKKNIYAASTGTTSKGLYVGNISQLTQVTTDEVKGVYVINSGGYKNNILWWNDYDLYLTHAARLVTSTSGEYWTVAFEDTDASYTACNATTTTNIALSGIVVVDGYTPSVGNRILVKDQTDKTQNGIYVVAAGSWTRATDFDASSEYTNYKKVSVSSGTLYGSSIWFLKKLDAFTLGTDDIEWDVYKLKVYSTDTPSGASSRSVISCVIQRDNSKFYNEYLVGHSNGVARILDINNYNSSISYEELYWEQSLLGGINSLYFYDDNSNYGKLYAGTNNGLFLSTELLWQPNTQLTSGNYRWIRTNSIFTEDDIDFTIFNKDYQSVSNYSLIYPYQMVSIGTSYIPGQQFYYEKNFDKFLTDPWYPVQNDISGSNTRVMMYIGENPSDIPFVTDAKNGEIYFTKSVPKDQINNVSITVSRDFKTIYDGGTKPHTSEFVPLAKSQDPIALLSFVSSPIDTIIYLNQTVDSSLKLLILKTNDNSEIVYVKSIDNTTYPIQVHLVNSRTLSNISYNAGTTVYSVKDDIVSGLEDDLQTILSQEKYNLSSANNSNVNTLARDLKKQIPTIYDFSAPVVTQTDTRGLKNYNLFTDFLTSNSVDLLNSTYKNRTQLIPSADDVDSNPVVIRNIFNTNKEGTDTRLATNQGIWKYVDNYWVLETTLNDAYDISYIAYDFNYNLIAGASNGVWKYTTSWVKDNSSDQKQNTYLTGYWDGELFEAFGKANGLTVNVYSNDKTSFVSDFLKLTSNNINGIFVGNHVKNQVSVSSFDCLHAAGDDGYYIISKGDKTSTFSPLLVARKMFSASNPDGVTKFYKSFQAYNIPAIPSVSEYSNMLFILTDDGVLRIKNWKYCYPDFSTTNDFVVDARFLRSRHCFCYALDKEETVTSVPGKSKIFIGTDNGVYRSFDGGYTFEPTQSLSNIPVSVYDLKVFSSTYNSTTSNVLVAATDNGIWYTIDDGDNWYRTAEQTVSSLSPVLFKSQPTNDLRIVPSDSSSLGYLSQTFVTSSTASTITKVSAYIIARDQDRLSSASYNDSLTNSTVTAYVYSLDNNNYPDTLLASSSAKTYADINLGGFTTFDLTSDLDIPGSGTTSLALVLKEVSSTVPLFSWKKSNLENPYTSGRAQYSSNDITWSGFSTSYDFFFKVHYDNNSSPTLTYVPVGNYDNSSVDWEDATYQGVLVDDNGYLKLDAKFIVSNLVDVSVSNQNSTGYSYISAGISTVIGSLVSRSTNTVTSYIDASTYSYSKSLNDLWTYGSTVIHRSSLGFTNSGIAITSSLVYFGENTNTEQAIDIASIGLQPQGVVDIFETGSSIANTQQISKVRDYLQERSLLRLSDIKTRYANESGLQLTLSPKTSASTGTTLYFSTDDTNTFTWNTVKYPYAEVVKNSAVLSSGFTVLPSQGAVSFTSAITSSDTVVLNLREDWDGGISTIPYSSSASSYMIERWSKSYIPIISVLTDGDDNTSNDYKSLSETLQTAWGNQGVKPLVFVTDKSSKTQKLRTLTTDNDGLLFETLSASDWTSANTSLIHGGANNLFTGTWNKEIKFETLKYIKSVHTNYTVSSGESVDSTCVVRFKYSVDKKTYSDWIILTSSYTLDKFVSGFIFDIVMKEGWNNGTSSAVKPYVQQLYYIEVDPITDYIFSNNITLNGNIINYILSTDYDDYLKSNLSWGVCQGNSTNWNDYTPLLTNKNGTLSNRQKSYKFVPQQTFEKLTCAKSNNNDVLYFAFNNGTKFTWSSDDTVKVYINSAEIATFNYILDNVNGSVKFRLPVTNQNLVQITVIKPKVRYISQGEGTITSDNVTYYLVNGRWAEDSLVVVYSDNSIIRGGYKLDRKNGRIVFSKARKSFEIITVSITPSSNYRIGLKVDKYNSSASNVYDFSFVYSAAKNTDAYAKYLNTHIPYISKDSLILSSQFYNSAVGSSAQIPFSKRLFVDYDYSSLENNQEFPPKVKWYRTRTTGIASTTVELDATPNYRNRVVQQNSDTNQANTYFLENDQVYVTVEPYDGFDYGIAYTSDPVILKNITIPYVYDLKYSSNNTIVDNTLLSGSTLIASYTPSDLTADQSKVEWYDMSSSEARKVYDGVSLPLTYILKGKIYSFTVTPYDGTTYGTPIVSPDIYII